MTIDVRHEQLITFAQLARALPRRRGDRPVHVATIHRWRSRGLQGIRLDAVRVGGAWHTSWEAFAIFSERLTTRAEGTDVCLHDTRNSQSHANADTSLESDGW